MSSHTDIDSETQSVALGTLSLHGVMPYSLYLPAMVMDSNGTPLVAVEQMGLRTRNGKTFAYEDGSGYARSYLHSIHYLEGDIWEEIDNTLIPDEDEPTVYRNRANNFTVYIETDKAETDVDVTQLRLVDDEMTVQLDMGIFTEASIIRHIL